MQVTAIPASGGPVQREAKEQEALFRWRDMVASSRYPGIEWMFAIPNGAHLQGDDRRRAAQWARLVRQGVRGGVVDIFLPVPRSPYAGLWIEMKASRPHSSAVSEDQKEWIAGMRGQGYAAEVARGWQEAVGIINRYYGYDDAN